MEHIFTLVGAVVVVGSGGLIVYGVARRLWLGDNIKSPHLE